MLKLLCLLTGDDYNLVAQETPASRKKISALATVLLIPVITWFTIGYAIGRTILNLPITASIMIGTVTATIILIIERTIIISAKNTWLVRLRIALGLLIAILGSVFLDEIIFKEDIEQQVFMDRKELIESERNRIQIDYTSSLTEAKKRVVDSYQEWLRALAEARQESDGSGGSGIRGIHTIAKLKLEISQKHEANYELAKEELVQLEEKLEADLKANERMMILKITGHSILFRIKSLFHLVFSDTWVLVIYLLFTCLLFILEFIVIIMKHALNETHYELRIQAMETVGKRRLSAIMERDIRIFDPANSSKEVMKAERALECITPSLFRATEKKVA